MVIQVRISNLIRVRLALVAQRSPQVIGLSGKNILRGDLAHLTARLVCTHQRALAIGQAYVIQ